MKFIFFVCLHLLTFIGISASAQTIKLSGNTKDSITGKILPYSTVSLYYASDSSFINYRLSNEEGKFEIKDLPTGAKLRLIVSHTGYEPYRHEFLITDNNQNLFLEVLLKESTISLDEVLVMAERPPVVIRQDTIEFNVEAFKTLPNALLEDLLKKLPGLEIEPDGRILVNGRSVTKIMVDGRDFFAGDIRIATRNLPANIIDKVQITNEKDELGDLLSPDLSAQSKIINLKLKKEIKKGWLGKVYGGIGTNKRFEGGGMINTFRDTLQISALGYINNINKSSFGLGDLQGLGGFGRSGLSSLQFLQSGTSLHGLSLGGSDNGIQQSSGYGINLNHDPSKKIKLNFQYFAGFFTNQLDEEINSEIYVGDTTQKNHNLHKEKKIESGHLISSTITWKPQKRTAISYTPIFLIKNSNEHTWQNMTSMVNFGSIKNEGSNILQLNNKHISTQHIIRITNKFKNSGGSLSGLISFSSLNDKYKNYYDIHSILGDDPLNNFALDQFQKESHPINTVSASL